MNETCTITKCNFQHITLFNLLLLENLKRQI